MNNFWVINTSNLKYSKNINENQIPSFLDIMEREHICLFGYFDSSGQTFKNKIELGDIIIVSQRGIREAYKRDPEHNYFAGIVNSDAYLCRYYDNDFQARKIKNFISLKGKKLTFKEDSISYPTVQPIYKLKTSNDKDKILIDEIKKIMDINMIKECKELLEQNYNLVLTGAPGTGKTYLAKQIAAKIIFNDDNKEYTEELEENEYFKNQCQFVQFHPSYDYTDFVEGLRPIKDSNGNIGFERKDGIFKKFCKEALKNRSSKFVFIIDEINRGEISKIFGELFFAIDPGYRGESGKVQTQYNNLINNDESDEDDEFEDGFFVPENVYIIGTMNDIDRSVESMDFAMRRRFAWKEIKAEDTQEDILKSLDSNIKQNAIDGMNALNNAISEIESFNSSYHIGASYFLKLKNYYNGGNIEEAFNSLWENHLRGLLYEYLRGMPDVNDKLEKLEDAYNSGCDNNTQSDSNTSQDSDN